MAFSSGFLSPPSSQALSWTSHTVSILILPDLYWVHPGSSASCSGPKQNKIWISAWSILKNDPVLRGESRLGCDLAAANFLFLFFFSNCGHTDRDLRSLKFTHKSTTDACTHAHTQARTHAHLRTNWQALSSVHSAPEGLQSWKMSCQHLPDGGSDGSKSLNIIKRNTWYRMCREEDSGSLTAVNTPADLPRLATPPSGLTVVFLTCGINFTF